eukprot:jgi/Chlat1/7932/Chrsp68S07387
MGLDVIGAGFGRTGTMSLKAALEQLGFNPCYHMAEIFPNPGDTQKWIDCAKQIQQGRVEHLMCYCCGRIFSSRMRLCEKGRPAYRASVDHPSVAYYEEMMKQYPNAKVILTVRDSPEEWYASAKSTIYEFNRGGSIMSKAMTACIPFLRRFLLMVDLGHAVAVYKRWVEEVKARVPKSKLLVFNLKEGWEPLCRFLVVPVPKDTDGTPKPFPRTNERAQFRAMIVNRERIAKGVTAFLGACLGIALWWFIRSH